MKRPLKSSLIVCLLIGIVLVLPAGVQGQTAVGLSMPKDAFAAAGGTVSVPVNIDPGQAEIYSISFDIVFNGTLLSVKDVFNFKDGDSADDWVAEEWSMDFSAEPGRVHVSMAGEAYLAEVGRLVDIEFEAEYFELAKAEKKETTLRFANLLLNEGSNKAF